MGELVARSRILSTQKAGNPATDYEDAAACDGVRGRFALADGASDAYDSGRWARLLVASFVAGELPVLGRAELDGWLIELAHRWSAEIPWDEISEPRHWYKYEKASLGDFATFLGLELAPRGQDDRERGQAGPTGDGRWRALAVGDTCLFHVRANELVPPSPFPISSRLDFDVTPPLVSTAQPYNRRSLESLRIVDGCYRPGDVFLLATDALACCMLAAWEEGESPWSRLGVLAPAEFDALVARLRRQARMRNDDVTLLVVHTEAANGESNGPRRGAAYQSAPPMPHESKELVPLAPPESPILVAPA